MTFQRTSVGNMKPNEKAKKHMRNEYDFLATVKRCFNAVAPCPLIGKKLPLSCPYANSSDRQ
jgi:hypothetical protein